MHTSAIHFVDASIRSKRRLSPPWLFAAAAMFVADLFLHLPITDICDGLVKHFGFVAYDQFLRRGFLLLGLLTVAAVAVRRTPRRSVNAAAATGWLLIAIAAQRLLLVGGIENVHYPQYALLTWLLIRGGLPVEISFVLGCLFGAADEAYQFAVLSRGTPGYFDWNDVVLNTLGSALGVLLARVVSDFSAGRELVSGRAVFTMCTIAVAIAWMSGPPQLTPFFTATPGGAWFHRITAVEAVLAVSCIWAGVRWLTVDADRREQIAAMIGAREAWDPPVSRFR